MANVKISDLTTAVLPLDGTEQAVVTQNAGSYKATTSDLMDAPAKRIRFDIANPGGNVEGALRWNPTTKGHEGCAGNVTIQYGFEQLRWGKNTSGGTLLNGKVVVLTGGDPVTKNPTIQGFIADGSMLGVHLLGVLTEDITNGAIGRMCTDGEVHDIDTTGVPYGETWVAGDTIYAHPTVAGGMTKVQPTAPKLSIPIGTVLFAHATTGVMLVNLVLSQQQSYGFPSSSVTQSQTSINTPKAITFDSANTLFGVSIGSPTSRLVIARAGAYDFTTSLQINKVGAGTHTLWLWARVNGVDLANSGSKVEISANGYAVITPKRAMLLNAGDYVELMWAVEDLGITLEATPAITSPFTMPAAPSVRLTVFQLNL